MPTSPPRLCAKCGARFTTPRCSCRKPWEGSKRTGQTSGGNARRWRRLRDNLLALNPLCALAGCNELATELDHIVPVAEGGAMWDEENLQGLCSDHHRVKTAAEALRARLRARTPQG